MLPEFLVEETTVRQSGESAVFDASEHFNHDLVLTFTITHAIERESIGIEIAGSNDGVSWSSRPVVSFTPKCYCGTYQVRLPSGEARYLKAKWRVLRWSRSDDLPFFRFHLAAHPAGPRVAAVGA